MNSWIYYQNWVMNSAIYNQIWAMNSAIYNQIWAMNSAIYNQNWAHNFVRLSKIPRWAKQCDCKMNCNKNVVTWII